MLAQARANQVKKILRFLVSGAISESLEIGQMWRKEEKSTLQDLKVEISH